MELDAVDGPVAVAEPHHQAALGLRGHRQAGGQALARHHQRVVAAGTEWVPHAAVEVAPVVAVRGNVDTQEWARKLPLTHVLEARGTSLYVIHNLQELDLDPGAAGFGVVISGHSHKPLHFEKAGVLYINPGSAGPRRFNLPVTVARLDIRKKPWHVDYIRCDGGPP